MTVPGCAKPSTKRDPGSHTACSWPGLLSLGLNPNIPSIFVFRVQSLQTRLHVIDQDLTQMIQLRSREEADRCGTRTRPRRRRRTHPHDARCRPARLALRHYRPASIAGFLKLVFVGVSWAHGQLHPPAAASCTSNIYGEIDVCFLANTNQVTRLHLG